MVKGIMAVWTDITPRAENDVSEWYNRQHLLERVDVPGFRNGARYRSGGGTTEQRELRGGADNLVDWVVLIEGTDARPVRAARARCLSVAALRSHGAAPGARSGLYRLMYTLSD